MESDTALLEADAIDLKPFQAVLDTYFETMNAQAFEQTAALFSEKGILRPPFEASVVGPEAIAAYLTQEAIGMKLIPLETNFAPLADGNLEAQVSGKVQTALFGVNVAWFFVLNSDAEIVSAHIKLLASLQDLAKINR